MPGHDRTCVCPSVDHRCDKALQFKLREDDGGTNLLCRSINALSAETKRELLALACAGILVIHIFLEGGIGPPILIIVSVPETASSATAGPLARCPFAINDPSLGQIVRRHFHVHAISNDRADPVTAHLPGRIGYNPVLIVECYAEASIGQNLINLAFHQNELFLRQTVCFHIKNNQPHAGESRCGAMQHEMEKELPVQLSDSVASDVGQFLYREILENYNARGGSISVRFRQRTAPVPILNPLSRFSRACEGGKVVGNRGGRTQNAGRWSGAGRLDTSISEKSPFQISSVLCQNVRSAP